MTREEAIELIRPALPAAVLGVWADFGAGRGTFTEALAALLPKDSAVIAVERDSNCLNDLRRLASWAKGARIVVQNGDVQDLQGIPGLAEQPLAGALFGNVLHYVPDPETVLTDLPPFMQPGASVVVIEYERRQASPWVPFPLPLDRLAVVARAAGLSVPREVGRRDSRYQGELYCAVMQVEE
jgi:ubiquinone/menaquinone biosynthesis C-methylase UbiE